MTDQEQNEEIMNDIVNHPSHYTDGKIEVWKNVKGFDNYLISNYGKVKNTMFNNRYCSFKKEHILKPSKNGQGYLFVELSKNGKSKIKTIHRLVAENFLQNIENFPCVNHIDGNKENNNVKNLEWCTFSHNIKHSYKLGLQKPSERQKKIISEWDSIHHKKQVFQFSLTGEFIKCWGSQKEAGMALNINKSSISNCVRKKSKSAGGYIWKETI